MKARGGARRSTTKTKRVSTKKQGLLWQNVAALAAVLVILIGIALAAKSVLVDPSEAAVRGILTPQTTTTQTGQLQRDQEQQDFIDEATRLFHDEYNACYRIQDKAAKCDCMAGVVKKLEDLRARIIATGKDYHDLINFWVDYYLKLIRQTMAALECPSGTTTIAKPNQPTTSVFSRITSWFSRL